MVKLYPRYKDDRVFLLACLHRTFFTNKRYFCNIHVFQIGAGIVVLIGLKHGDTERECEILCRKILAIRLWPSEDGRPWCRSVVDMGYEILLGVLYGL